jgi:thiol-disulfide isomerase/thioredoxin
MKMIHLIVVLLFTMGACKNQEDSSNRILEEGPLSTLTVTDIPVITFDELQKRIFNVDNDTLFVVNFWATWCKPCVKELPAFELAGSTFKESNLKIVLVSLDFPEHLEKGVLPFIMEKGLTNEVVILDDPDANTWIPLVSNEWSGAIPATVMVKNGKKQFYEQSFTSESLDKEIRDLLENTKS